MMVDLFTLGLVKGINENNDAGKHFSSLLGISSHKAAAIKDGYLTEDGKGLTDKGLQLYESARLVEAPRTYCIYWRGSTWFNWYRSTFGK